MEPFRTPPCPMSGVTARRDMPTPRATDLGSATNSHSGALSASRERRENPVGRFAADHLRPQTRYSELATQYDNLLYVCTSCNAVKGDQEVADPTQTLLATTVVVEDDGTLVGRTPEAAELLELLKLNYRTLRQRRQLLMAAIRVFRDLEPELYGRWMGFPDDLPDLSRLRPPGRKLPPGGPGPSLTLPAVNGPTFPPPTKCRPGNCCRNGTF